MFLRLFKNSGPAAIFYVIITCLGVWAGAFLKIRNHFSLYFDLNPMPLYGYISNLFGTHPLPGIITALALMFLMAFLLVNLNTTLFFLNERSFLPALIYILLIGLVPQYQLLNPAVFGAVALIIAIRRIMDSYRLQGVAYNYFDAGIILGIGSLFYADLIWYGALLIAGIAILRTVSVRELLLSLAGLFTPWLLTLAIFYVAGHPVKDFLRLIYFNLFEKTEVFPLSNLSLAALAFSSLLAAVSIFYLLMKMNVKKIQARKTFSLLLWVLVVSIAVYLISRSVSIEILWIAGIPVSYLLTHYFIFAKRKVINEILFSGFVLLVVLLQVLAMK